MSTSRSFLRWLLPPLIVLLALAVVMALVKTRPGARTQTPPDERISVSTQTVQPGRVVPQKLLHGRIIAPQQVKLSAALSADVRALTVREGEHITRGQELLRLDDREIRWLVRQREAEYRQRQAQVESERNRQQADQALLEHEQQLLELAREAVRRAETLENRSLASQSSLDEARRALLQQTLALEQRRRAISDHPARLAALEAQRDQAKARLEQARLQLEHTRLLSPFAGRVAAVHVAAGQHVRQGNALLDIFDDGQLEIRAPLPAGWLQRWPQARLHGLPARARIDGRVYELRLARLSASLNRGALDAFFHFEDDPRGLPLDQVVELVLDLPPAEQAFVLPGEALYGTDRIYRIVDGRLRQVRVEHLGNRYMPREGLVVLRSDQIQPGDQVLISKFATASDGLAVKVR